MQTIFPILRYIDARSAMRSLCATFGFVELDAQNLCWLESFFHEISCRL